VHELTRLNFVFAFADPATFDIVTMDPDTPAALFVDAANAKVINPKLHVWLSIGGWTFWITARPLSRHGETWPDYLPTARRLGAIS
jgi:hypothetical protein